MEPEWEKLSEPERRRARRHQIILWVAMVILIALPFVFLAARTLWEG